MNTNATFLAVTNAFADPAYVDGELEISEKRGDRILPLPRADDGKVEFEILHASLDDEQPDGDWIAFTGESLSTETRPAYSMKGVMRYAGAADCDFHYPELSDSTFVVRGEAQMKAPVQE